MIGIFVTSFNRPAALERTLPQIAALGAPTLIVDDGSSIISEDVDTMRICLGIQGLRLPENRGLAAAMNIGLSYWLADKSIEWISYFQDDVDVHPRTLEILQRYHGQYQIMTGHDAGEHKPHHEMTVAGLVLKEKWVIRATHIHAHRDFWAEQMPIPTRELGAPKRLDGSGRGLGSNVDWWVCRDGPRSCRRTDRPVLCVPGLVRSFLWKAEDSSWANTQRAGEDAPLGEFA